MVLMASSGKVPGVSFSMSFTGWSVWQWLSGRKRMIVTVAAALLSLWITNEAVVSVVVGGVVEAIWAIGEFYFSEVRL
jgi:hypothetical protein